MGQTRLEKRMANIEAPKFFDEFDLLNTQPGQHDDNGVMFLALWVIRFQEKWGRLPLDSNKIHDAIYSMQIERGVFAQTPLKLNDPASHDNVTAIVYLSRAYGLNFHKEIKILGHFWHPRDWAFYGRLKYGKKFDYLTLNIFSVFMFVSNWLSYNKTYKKRPTFIQKIKLYLAGHGWKKTEKAIHTDGKFLMWIRTSTNLFPKTKNKCYKILLNKYGANWKQFIIETYFTNPKHPLRSI